MKCRYYLLVLTGLVSLFSACKDPGIEIDNPSTYRFERDGQSTINFSGQSTRIAMAEELISAMKNVDQNETALLEMFANQTANGEDANPFSDEELNNSNKSIKSKVAASKDFFGDNTTESAEIKANFESWIKAQINEVFPNQNELAEAGKAGQIADGTSVRYVSSKGLEYNQAVNKALIGALMVDQMLNNYLSTAVLDEGNNRTENDEAKVADGENYTTMEHKWDEAYGYLFGASADASNPIPALGEDSFLNKYLAKVNTDSDFTGIAGDIYNAFKLGRAAIVAKDYKLRDEQAYKIKDLVSEVMAIRTVYYLQQAKSNVQDQARLGMAFHDLSEGYGFIFSLRFLRKSTTNEPYFTKEETNNFMNQLMEGNGFWEVEPSTLDNISNKIAAKFDFTIDQAADIN